MGEDEVEASPSQLRMMSLVAVGGGVLGGVIMALAVYFMWDLRSVELDESQSPVSNLGEIIGLLARLGSPLLAFMVGAVIVNSYMDKLIEQQNVELLSLRMGKYMNMSSLVTALTCGALLGTAVYLDFI